MEIGLPLRLDIALYRGDSGSFRVSVVDTENNPVDISAATWLSQIRAKQDDTAPMATFDVTPVDNYSVDVILTPEQSALIIKGGYWDLQMTLDAQVSTLLSGQVKLTKDVSRA